MHDEILTDSIEVTYLNSFESFIICFTFCCNCSQANTAYRHQTSGNYCKHHKVSWRQMGFNTQLFFNMGDNKTYKIWNLQQTTYKDKEVVFTTRCTVKMNVSCTIAVTVRTHFVHVSFYHGQAISILSGSEFCFYKIRSVENAHVVILPSKLMDLFWLCYGIVRNSNQCSLFCLFTIGIKHVQTSLLNSNALGFFMFNLIDPASLLCTIKGRNSQILIENM